MSYSVVSTTKHGDTQPFWKTKYLSPTKEGCENAFTRHCKMYPSHIYGSVKEAQELFFNGTIWETTVLSSVFCFEPIIAQEA